MIPRRALITGLLAAPLVSRIPGLLMPVRAIGLGADDVITLDIDAVSSLELFLNWSITWDRSGRCVYTPPPLA